MVQNTANSIIVPQIPVSNPGNTAAAKKDDVGSFDKAMREQLEKDGNHKLTDPSDRKEQADVKDPKDLEELQETVSPQLVLQWLTSIPGEKQASQTILNFEALQNSGAAAPNPGETIAAVSGNETNETTGQQIPMDGKNPKTSGQEPLSNEKLQELQNKPGFQVTLDEPVEEQGQKQSVPVVAEADIAGTKEAAEANATTKKEAVETLHDVPVKTEQEPEAHLLQGNVTSTEVNTNAVQKPAVSEKLPLEFSRPESMDKLGDMLAKTITSGKQEFEIQLEPLNLGKMLVKVSYEAGRAAISIVCSESKTMQAMAQNAKELGSILESHMGTQTQVIVDKGQPSDYLEQQAQQEKNHQDEQTQQNHKKEAENDDAEAVSFLQQLRLGLV